MPNYWVVGAMWEGRHDMLSDFLAGGYWYLGWTPEQDVGQNALRDQMVIGDRIAIKRMLGHGSTDIEIGALGIIKHIDAEDGYRRIYVNPVIGDLKRRAPSKGCVASVHSPFSEQDEWTQRAFCL